MLELENREIVLKNNPMILLIPVLIYFYLI